MRFADAATPNKTNSVIDMSPALRRLLPGGFLQSGRVKERGCREMKEGRLLLEQIREKQLTLLECLGMLIERRISLP